MIENLLCKSPLIIVGRDAACGLALGWRHGTYRTHMTYPSTIIVRHPKENPRKCSVMPLKGRADIVFVNYPARTLPALEGYVRLAAEGPELSAADAACGVLLLDGSWRWAG